VVGSFVRRQRLQRGVEAGGGAVASQSDETAKRRPPRRPNLSDFVSGWIWASQWRIGLGHDARILGPGSKLRQAPICAKSASAQAMCWRVSYCKNLGQVLQVAQVLIAASGLLVGFQMLERNHIDLQPIKLNQVSGSIAFSELHA